MKSIQQNSTDKMSVAPAGTSAEFQLIVGKLKALKLRGDEAVQHSVELIHEYQQKFGNSEKQLKTLATAVGVTTRTFYRWIKQVEDPDQVSRVPFKRPKSETISASPSALTADLTIFFEKFSRGLTALTKEIEAVKTSDKLEITNKAHAQELVASLRKFSKDLADRASRLNDVLNGVENRR